MPAPTRAAPAQAAYSDARAMNEGRGLKRRSVRASGRSRSMPPGCFAARSPFARFGLRLALSVAIGGASYRMRRREAKAVGPHRTKTDWIGAGQRRVFLPFSAPPCSNRSADELGTGRAHSAG